MKAKAEAAKSTKGGRPAHRATADRRERVNVMLALGWTQATIAAVLGIDPTTLRHHYARELADRHAARDRLRLKMILLLIDAAVAGKVSAIANVQRVLDDATQAEATARRAAQLEPKAAPLGKKEEQQRDAEAVEGKFRPPGAPRRLN